MMHTPKTPRTMPTAAALVALTLLLLLCLSACEIPPTETAPPKLRDIKPTAQPDNLNDVKTDTNKPAAGTPIGALIYRVDLPLDVSLDACWETVDESAVPLRTHGMWQANGLRIGILNAQNAPAFADALPTIRGESRAKLLGTPYPSSIRSTPRLMQPVTIDLTDPPKSLNILNVHGGRLQLLAKITRDETGQAYLELTPHHYKRKVDLIPRSPLEKQLDGRVFTELTARLPLTPNTAVVVGLYRPWPEAEVTEDAVNNPVAGTNDVVTNTQTTPENPKTASESDAPDLSSDPPSALTDQPSPPQPPAIPNHLGKALMAGKRAGHTIQVIMVISLIEDW